jgi:hypothetical protein
MEKKSLYAASKNKDPIFQVLNPRLKLLLADNAKVIEKYELTPEGSGEASLISPADRASLSVLEVAAGTGEHAAYVGENSDIIENDVHYIIMEPDATMHESILAWSKDTEEKKINFKYSTPIGVSLSMEDPSPDFSKGPIAVIAGKNIGSVDVIICINMIHISHISSTEALFRLGRAAIRKGGLLYLYGPYRVNGNLFFYILCQSICIVSTSSYIKVSFRPNMFKYTRNYGAE